MAWQKDPLLGISGKMVPNTAWVKLTKNAWMYFQFDGIVGLKTVWDSIGASPSDWLFTSLNAGDYLCVAYDYPQGTLLGEYYQLDLDASVKYYPDKFGIKLGDGSTLNNASITAPGQPANGVYWPDNQPVYIKKGNCQKLDSPPPPLYGDTVKATPEPTPAPAPKPAENRGTAQKAVVQPQVIPDGLSDATYEDNIWSKDVTKKGKYHYDPYFFRDCKMLQDGNLDITIDYGPRSRSQQVIKSAYLRSVGIEMDASGNPIYEVYDVVARDIEDPEEFILPQTAPANSTTTAPVVGTPTTPATPPAPQKPSGEFPKHVKVISGVPLTVRTGANINTAPAGWTYPPGTDIVVDGIAEDNEYYFKITSEGKTYYVYRDFVEATSGIGAFPSGTKLLHGPNMAENTKDVYVKEVVRFQEALKQRVTAPKLIADGYYRYDTLDAYHDFCVYKQLFWDGGGHVGPLHWEILLR